MKLVSIGGDRYEAVIVGTPQELRRLAPLLDADVMVLPATPEALDETPAKLMGRLNARRIERGLSWRAIARDLDVAPSTFARWYHGSGHPSARVLLAAHRWLSGG